MLIRPKCSSPGRNFTPGCFEIVPLVTPFECSGGPGVPGTYCAGPGLQLLPRDPEGTGSAEYGARYQQLQVSRLGNSPKSYCRINKCLDGYCFSVL